ncbi:MAG: hypothetical protein ACRBCS_03115 [Cellvibrionaceae bacterium]
MGWLTSIFSAPEIVKSGLDAVVNGADKSFLTKEEQTEYFLKFVEASQPSNITRRVIGCSACLMWIIGGILGSVLLIVDHSKAEDVTRFFVLYVMPTFNVIVSWYFWKRMKS